MILTILGKSRLIHPGQFLKRIFLDVLTISFEYTTIEFTQFKPQSEKSNFTLWCEELSKTVEILKEETAPSADQGCGSLFDKITTSETITPKDLFGLKDGFTETDVKIAYHKLSRALHPDKNLNAESAAKALFHLVGFAKNQLLNKQNYPQTLAITN